MTQLARLGLVFAVLLALALCGYLSSGAKLWPW